MAEVDLTGDSGNEEESQIQTKDTVQTETNAAPTTENFIPLEKVPPHVADPEGECLDHSSTVIRQRLRSRETNVVSSMEATASKTGVPWLYTHAVNTTTHRVCFWQVRNPNLKINDVALEVMAGHNLEVKKPAERLVLRQKNPGSMR